MIESINLLQTIGGDSPEDVRLLSGDSCLDYNNADQVETTTTPAPGTGASAQTTTTSYDGMVRPWKTTYADGTSLTNEYWASGTLKRTCGSRTYPTGTAMTPRGG